MSKLFGGQKTMREKANAAESRLGKTTGASKGSKPAPKPKVKPTGSMKKPGVKVEWKF